MSEPYDPLQHAAYKKASAAIMSNPYESSAEVGGPDRSSYPRPGGDPHGSASLGVQAQQTPLDASALSRQRLQAELDATKDIMTENARKMVQRGELLDHMEERADQLSITSQNFKRSATDVRKRMWWKNMKWWICLAIFVLILIIGGVIGGIKHKEIVEVLHPPSTSGIAPPPAPAGLNSPGPNGMGIPLPEIIKRGQ